jgi:hypothetical protein
MLEALPGVMLQALFRIDLSMPHQYGVNRTNRFDLDAFIPQDAPYLGRSPGRLLGSNSQNVILKLRIASRRGFLRASGMLHQPRLADLPIPSNPLIRCCRTNPISTAQLPDVRIVLAR